MIKLTDKDLNYTTMTDVNIQGISEYYRKIMNVFNAESDWPQVWDVRDLRGLIDTPCVGVS